MTFVTSHIGKTVMAAAIAMLGNSAFALSCESTTAGGTYATSGAFNIGQVFASVPNTTVNDCYTFATTFGFTLNGYFSYFLNLDSGGIGVIGAPGNLNASFLNHAQAGQFGDTTPGDPSATFSAGSYTLWVNLNGNAYTGPASNPDLYAGKVYINAVTPVPEAQTYALLLAGLGVLGFIGKRRLRGDGRQG